MAKTRSDSRFGFGQTVGTVGVLLLGAAVSQPWLKFDIAVAFRQALQKGALPSETAGQILFTGSSGPLDKIKDSPQVATLARHIGVADTGWSQDKYLAGAIIAAALLALVGVIRSVYASSAYGARRNSPLLAVSGLGAIVCAAVELWILAPEPRVAMKPDTGLWLLAAGGVMLLLGALTLGNNRRRPFLDDLDADRPMKSFDNTEHLAYSHGAWVPRLPDDRS
jgi:hypothetical protein